MSEAVVRGRTGAERFLLLHAGLIPLAFALGAILVRLSGLDERLATAFFDASSGGFPARQWPMLETLGHRLAKSAVLAVWAGAVAGAIAASALRRFRQWAPVLWAVVVGMAIGPTIVVALKNVNSYRCPWDLARFGGLAEQTGEWFVSQIHAGRCFPSGHAAGGFSLVALYFAGIATGNGRLRAVGLAGAVAGGVAFSLVRMAQGAHFLSHNLWSAAIDWCGAALVFASVIVPCAERPTLVRACTAAGIGLAGVGTPALPAGKPGHRGTDRLVRAFGYSILGLRAVWRREEAFRQEVWCCLVLVPVALLLPIGRMERWALLASLGLVLVVELVNSALEAVVDLAAPGHHPLAAVAKDAGSAAVLVALLVASGTWLAVLL